MQQRPDQRPPLFAGGACDEDGPAHRRGLCQSYDQETRETGRENVMKERDRIERKDSDICLEFCLRWSFYVGMVRFITC